VNTNDRTELGTVLGCPKHAGAVFMVLNGHRCCFRGSTRRWRLFQRFWRALEVVVAVLEGPGLAEKRALTTRSALRTRNEK